MVARLGGGSVTAAHKVITLEGEAVTLLYRGKAASFPSRTDARCLVCGLKTLGLVWYGPEPRWQAEPVCDHDFLWAKGLGAVV